MLSTLGLTEDDVTAISAIEGVESAIPVYTYDVLTEKDEKQTCDQANVRNNRYK